MVAKKLLVLGDLHAPFHHPDAFRFMEALKKAVKPDRVVHIGDEVDWHSQSYHEKNPDLPHPGEELRLVRQYMRQLHTLFPKMDVIDSNHGNLPTRKAQTIGFPSGFLQDKNSIYDIPKGWEYHFDLELALPRNQKVYFHHGKSSNVVNTAKEAGVNTVQGHYHGKMGVTWFGQPDRMLWAAQTGCLVDHRSLAMAYGKNNLSRALLGSLVVLDGKPSTIPMILNKKGRWVGEL